jgi:DNA-binding IclR family transcriptional regulator
MGKANNPVKSTNRSLLILEALHELESAGVTELADHLGMNKGTVHHHLSTLEEQAYVVNDGSSYRLGLRLFEMGIQTRRLTPVYAVARDDVDRLAEETGEMANLMVEEHGRGTYVYISRGDKAVKLDTKVGTRQYLHTSALGKSILAHMPRERLEAVIQRHGLPAETPNTVTDRSVLMDELERIRETGVAFDGEERAEGIRCVAAPITDNRDELVGAVSVSGPSSRIKGERFKEEIPEMVESTATVIGINVSYS